MRSNSKVRQCAMVGKNRFEANGSQQQQPAEGFACMHYFFCVVTVESAGGKGSLCSALMAAMMAALSREKKEQAGDREQFLHLPHCSHHTVWPSDTANGASTTEGGGGRRRRPCKYKRPR